MLKRSNFSFCIPYYKLLFALFVLGILLVLYSGPQDLSLEGIRVSESDERSDDERDHVILNQEDDAINTHRTEDPVARVSPHDREQIPDLSSPATTVPPVMMTPQHDEKKKQDILFLKTHKCGTSTLVNVFYLYGIRRKMNFVTNPFQRQLNLSRELLPPREGEHYNIQCAHVHFAPEIAHEVLPKNRTFYTTIVRSPISLFKSNFMFFGYDRFNSKNGTLNLEDSINNWKGKFTKMRPNNETVPIGWVCNSLANDLGFRDFMKKTGVHIQHKIDDFISHLYKEFDLVMLTDYYDESLVMLKEMLGWEYNDILYLNRFVSTNTRKHQKISLETEQFIKLMMMVDDQIYKFFYQAFQIKIDAFGRERFTQKVAEFKALRQEFEDKCFNKSAPIVGMLNTVSWEFSEFGMTNSTCQILQYSDSEMGRIVSSLQVTQDFEWPDQEERMEKYKKKPLEEWQIEMLKSVQREYQ